MSGALIMRGTSQFPNPPIIDGITKKKIMMNAWAVTITLYNWESINKEPGRPSSNRMTDLRAVPIKAAQILKMKYSVPISL